MKINEILKEDEKLYNRKKFVIMVEFDSQTPSKKELSKMLAAKYSSKKENVVIRNIDTSYGLRKAKVNFMIYNNVDDLKKIELKHQIKRNTFEDKKSGDDNDK